MHQFIYNGRSSADFNLVLSGEDTWKKPLPDFDRTQIPGRNGDLVLSNKRYKNVDIKNPKVITPYVPNYTVPVWHIYGIRCAERDRLEKYLNGKGIGTNKHYPIPMHLQECYRDLDIEKGSLPIAEEISATELSIPMFYGMDDEEIQYVIDTINEF